MHGEGVERPWYVGPCNFLGIAAFGYWDVFAANYRAFEDYRVKYRST